MSISVSSSGSMSPKDQFSFDKKKSFIAEKITLGTNAYANGTGFPASPTAQVTAPYVTALGTGDVGYAFVEVYHMLMTRGGAVTQGIDWTKTVTFGVRAIRLVGSAVQSDSEFRLFLGRSYSTSYGNTAEPSVGNNMVGFKQVGAGALQFMCSNGTAVSTITTTYTPIKDIAYDVIFECSGGVAKMYVNDVLVGTNTTAPTTASGVQAMALWVGCENKTAIVSPNKAHDAYISDYFLTVL